MGVREAAGSVKKSGGPARKSRGASSRLQKAIARKQLARFDGVRPVLFGAPSPAWLYRVRVVAPKKSTPDPERGILECNILGESPGATSPLISTVREADR